MAYCIIECLNCGALGDSCKCSNPKIVQRIETEPEDYGIYDNEDE